MDHRIFYLIYIQIELDIYYSKLCIRVAERVKIYDPEKIRNI